MIIVLSVCLFVFNSLSNIGSLDGLFIFYNCANQTFYQHKSMKNTKMFTAWLPEMIKMGGLVVNWPAFSPRYVAWEMLFVMLMFQHERVMRARTEVLSNNQDIILWATWSRTKLFETGDVWELRFNYNGCWHLRILLLLTNKTFLNFGFPLGLHKQEGWGEV